MSKGKTVKSTETGSSEVLLKFSVIVLVIWVLSAIAIYYLIPTWSARGTFGDMFGAVNALFSGLAFAALIYTIILQREEIRMNRQEIKLNRKELSKSTVAQVNSQKSLQDQVIQTHLTAKINAMSTIINYYNTQILNVNTPPDIVELARKKRKLLIMKMDSMIDGLQDSEVE